MTSMENAIGTVADVEKTSIVLVIKPFSHQQGQKYNNIDRFLKIGMMTYNKFLDVQSIQDFFVIVPAEDVDRVKKLLVETFPTYPWNVLNEMTLLHPSLPPGWARQQTVKLTISVLVKTSTYLIIDDDTYLTKPFSAKDLCDPTNGKLIMNKTHIDFPFFFLWSTQVLKYDFEKVQDFPVHMAITPEVFVVQVVRNLMKWLMDEYGANKKWQLHIYQNKYTEYCLYWIWLMKQEKVHELYAVDSPLALYGHATTGTEHDLGEQVMLSFKNNKYYWFSFVQSSLPYAVNDIYAKVKNACESM